LDASRAVWFFIPYDVSADAYYNKNNNIDLIEKKLLESALFQRRKGADHFFIDSSEPFWYEKKEVVSKFYKTCSHCLKLTPSTLHVPYQKWQHEFKVDETWVPIPYTSTWHYFERNEAATDEYKPWAWEFDIHAMRNNLIVFVGIIKKMVPSATNLRRFSKLYFVLFLLAVISLFSS